MPVLTFAPHIDRLRGAITGNLADGLVYFDIGNGVARARRNLKPVQPNTALQSVRRNALAMISNAYANLTADKIAGWEAIVNDPRFPTQEGRLGVSRKLTARELFTRWNANLMCYLGNVTIFDTAPTANSLFVHQECGAPSNTVTSLVVTESETPAGIKLAVTLIPMGFDYALGVRLTRQFSRAARKPRRVDLFAPGKGAAAFEAIIPITAADQAQTATFSLNDLPDDYGTVNPADYIGVELVPLNDGGGYSGKPSFFAQNEIQAAE